MILDTNAVSAFFDGDRLLKKIIASAPELCLPVIVLGEYNFGLINSRERKRIELALADFVLECRVLPVDVETVPPYAAIRSELKSAGKPMPSNDVWIAALAIQHDLMLYARDAHFDHLPQLPRI